MRVLVLGAGGQLGGYLTPAARAAGHEVHARTHAELDITDAGAVDTVIADLHPDVVVNAAALTGVDASEGDPERAHAVNAVAVGSIGAAAARVAAHVVHISTDYVFDGTAHVPYRESDPTNPVNVYGRSKLAGEKALAASGCGWTVVRTSWVFGAPATDLPHWAITSFEAGTLTGVLADAESVPTFAGDLSGTLLDVAVRRFAGVLHVVNGGSGTRHDLCVASLAAVGLDGSSVPRIAADALNRSARRPDYTVLDTTTMQEAGFTPLRHWRDALLAYLKGET